MSLLAPKESSNIGSSTFVGSDSEGYARTPVSQILSRIDSKDPCSFISALGLPMCDLLLSAAHSPEAQKSIAQRGPLVCMLIKHAIRTGDIKLLTRTFKLLSLLVNLLDADTVQALGTFLVALLDLSFTSLQVSITAPANNNNATSSPFRSPQDTT